MSKLNYPLKIADVLRDKLRELAADQIAVIGDGSIGRERAFDIQFSHERPTASGRMMRPVLS